MLCSSVVSVASAAATKRTKERTAEHARGEREQEGAVERGRQGEGRDKGKGAYLSAAAPKCTVLFQSQSWCSLAVRYISRGSVGRILWSFAVHELGACRQQQQGEASAFREKPVDNEVVSQSERQTADHIAWHTCRCRRSRSTLSVPYVYDRQDCCSVRGYAMLCYAMLCYAVRAYRLSAVLVHSGGHNLALALSHQRHLHPR